MKSINSLVRVAVTVPWWVIQSRKTPRRMEAPMPQKDVTIWVAEPNWP